MTTEKHEPALTTEQKLQVHMEAAVQDGAVDPTDAPAKQAVDLLTFIKNTADHALDSLEQAQIQATARQAEHAKTHHFQASVPPAHGHPIREFLHRHLDHGDKQ